MNVRRIHDDAVAADRIAARIALRKLINRGPSANIRPADIGGDNRGLVGEFHHCVVDRFLRRLRKRIFVEHQEFEIFLCLQDGVDGGFENSGR